MCCMTDDRRIGIVIRRARERKRWTQKDLAKAVGVSRTTVDAWENDRSWPRNRIGAIEAVLGISLNGGPPPAPAPGELSPTDDWERSVLDDPYLSGDDKRWLVTESRENRGFDRPAITRRQCLQLHIGLVGDR